ncbi:mandelate racemase [Skermanella stibiiresistens SB22]|uniref:Dipeptide epimerase n=1 Tax=Skermanella stibiiresistens SB22 TaxID=1385369 RepID=W9H5C3_9PROT|nr:N-acetyl-D-Glu racemase DgcA [Skermanella stibiiresistens]EWY41435.1 mandelate racemase [Skermanella stibiiresistens SB22]
MVGASAKRTLSVRREVFPIRGTFRISRGAKTEAHVVVAEIDDGGVVGRGECVPYARYGESMDSVVEQIEGVASAIAAGLDQEGLLDALPAGAARNAVDCALWDLSCKLTGQPIWQVADLEAPLAPVVTAYTLSLDTVENMAAAARASARRPLLKLKLTGDGDLERVTAVRENAPDARLIVDANEGWTLEHLKRYGDAFAKLAVELIEQPLPAGRDDDLLGFECPVPLGADESCHDRSTLDELRGKYQVVNIKLDKTGGLTEAMRLKAAAEAAGFDIMVGCMLASSLAMAPGVVIAQGAKLVDLDGPLLLAEDRKPGLRFEGETVFPPEPSLWG